MGWLASRVWETSTGTGSGPFTLAGAKSARYQRFATKFPVGAPIYYTIEEANGSNWMEVEGTLLSSTSISVDTIFDGSSGPGKPVSFGSGTKNVFNEAPAWGLRGSNASLNLCVMGDSRFRYGYRGWKNIGTADLHGLGLDLIGTTGSGITSDAVSSGAAVRFYAGSPPSLTWTAPSDSEGAHVNIPCSGIYNLESATANKGIRVGYFSTATPVTNQTILVDVTGSMRFGYEQYGPIIHTLRYLRHPFSKVVWGSIGSAGIADLVTQLQQLADQSSPYYCCGPGWDIIQIGTNDIITNVSLASCTANLKTIFDDRLARGRKLVIVSENARWGVNTSTAITSAQLAVLIGVNNFERTYAAKYPDDVIFVNAYELGVDPGFTDGRPKSGYLRDVVHPSATECKVLGEAIAKAMLQAGATGTPITYGVRMDQGDLSNLAMLPITPTPGLNGCMIGTSGANDTGSSGTVPTGWRAGRASGADATVVNSIVARTDTGGNWWQAVIAGTTTGQIIQFSSTNGSTLAQLGVAAGDLIRPEMEIEITSATAMEDLDVYWVFFGATSQPEVHGLIDTTDGTMTAHPPGLYRAPDTRIPPGTTSIGCYVWAYLLASAAATIHMGNMVIQKVTVPQQI